MLLRTIDTLLRTVVAEQPCLLLFAAISGAHLYGFPSPDSDYDLRGVHVLPLREVVGLGERRAPGAGTRSGDPRYREVLPAATARPAHRGVTARVRSRWPYTSLRSNRQPSSASRTLDHRHRPRAYSRPASGTLQRRESHACTIDCELVLQRGSVSVASPGDSRVQSTVCGEGTTVQQKGSVVNILVTHQA
jgi:hypothetical protein